jgi:hypothetical protein
VKEPEDQRPEHYASGDQAEMEFDSTEGYVLTPLPPKPTEPEPEKKED